MTKFFKNTLPRLYVNNEVGLQMSWRTEDAFHSKMLSGLVALTEYTQGIRKFLIGKHGTSV